jgi:hypothetical protein
MFSHHFHHYLVVPVKRAGPSCVVVPKKHVKLMANAQRTVPVNPSDGSTRGAQRLFKSKGEVSNPSLTPQVFLHFYSVKSSRSRMGRPAESNVAADESLTVRDNRTGKTYNIPYVAIGAFRRAAGGAVVKKK